MTRSLVIETVRRRWIDAVQTPGNLEVQHDNAPAPAAPSSFRHDFSVQIDDERQAMTGQVGSRRFRIRGRAIAVLKCPVGEGDKALMDVAESATTAFMGYATTNPIIWFDRPTLGGQVMLGEGRAARTLTIPFEADVFG